jgi:hypothetical protein
MVAESIASLNVAATLVLSTTPVAASAGTTEATVGAVVSPVVVVVGEQPITANPAMSERMSGRYLECVVFFMDALPYRKRMQASMTLFG